MFKYLISRVRQLLVKKPNKREKNKMSDRKKAQALLVKIKKDIRYSQNLKQTAIDLDESFKELEELSQIVELSKVKNEIQEIKKIIKIKDQEKGIEDIKRKLTKILFFGSSMQSKNDENNLHILDQSHMVSKSEEVETRDKTITKSSVNDDSIALDKEKVPKDITDTKNSINAISENVDKLYEGNNKSIKNLNDISHTLNKLEGSIYTGINTVVKPFFSDIFIKIKNLVLDSNREIKSKIDVSDSKVSNAILKQSQQTDNQIKMSERNVLQGVNNSLNSFKNTGEKLDTIKHELSKKLNQEDFEFTLNNKFRELDDLKEVAESLEIVPKNISDIKDQLSEINANITNIKSNAPSDVKVPKEVKAIDDLSQYMESGLEQFKQISKLYITKMSDFDKQSEKIKNVERDINKAREAGLSDGSRQGQLDCLTLLSDKFPSLIKSNLIDLFPEHFSEKLELDSELEITNENKNEVSPFVSAELSLGKYHVISTAIILNGQCVVKAVLNKIVDTPPKPPVEESVAPAEDQAEQLQELSEDDNTMTETEAANKVPDSTVEQPQNVTGSSEKNSDNQA